MIPHTQSPCPHGIKPSLTIAILALSASAGWATPFNLGEAGPGNFAILETGNGNVSLANAANSGYVNGSIGVAGSGNVSDGGSLPIHGNVYLGSAAGQSGLSGNVSGSVIQNVSSQVLLSQAAIDAAAASLTLSGMASAGGGVGVSSITSGQTLGAGVYNLSQLQLNNGAHLILSGSASDQFIFNISGTLSLNSAQILLSGGLTSDDVIFNITGSSAVQFSGGLNNESILNGIILAEGANVQVTPGEVNGEIIGGANINIASGGSVNCTPPLPDGGKTMVMLGAALFGVTLMNRRLESARTSR